MEKKRTNRDIYGIPKHKFNIRSAFTFSNGLLLDIRLHYVDDTKWQRVAFERVDDYLRLDRHE